MKKFLLVILLALSTATLTTKAYTPLVREGVEWGYCTCNTNAYGFMEFFRLQFKGTEVIEGVEYHKLYYYKTNKLNVHTIEHEARLVAYMREEDKKVYARYPQFSSPMPDFLEWAYNEKYTKESLLMDFGIMEGEQEPFRQRTCEKIDVLNYGDATRQAFHFLGLTCVEGMGPIHDGDMTYPDRDYATASPDPMNRYAFLLYERETTEADFNDLTSCDQGDIVFKTPYFERFGKYDPTNWIFKVDLNKVNSEIDIVCVPEESVAAPVYYNLNGMQVNPDRLTSGVYVRKTGSKVEKIRR